MNRICLLVIAGILSGCAHSGNDIAATSLAADETVVVDNPGQVTVAGVTSQAALGAINTQQVIANPTVTNGGETTSEKSSTDANGAISVEGAQPAAVLGAIDPKKLIDKPPKDPK
ncbi:MAG: hypothetical protein ABMA14_02340 [Hyphomonadaceae bacterium]